LKPQPSVTLATVPILHMGHPPESITLVVACADAENPLQEYQQQPLISECPRVGRD
jgi:hypothetical protein